MLSPILVDSRGFLVEGQIEAEQRMDDTHFEPQPYSQCSVTYIPVNTVNSIFTGVTYKSWALTHTRIFSPTCFMSLLHTNTEITLRIEPVTGARFDFIPSLPSRLSLGLSHKQSPSSRSRYEISFVGCWQVPHVGSATCVSLSYLCVCLLCAYVCEGKCEGKKGVSDHTYTHMNL